MMQLEQVVSAYGATRGNLTKTDGGTEEYFGPGGGLVAAVEQQGLDGVAAMLEDGQTLSLEDADVTLTLARSGACAQMRVSWTDGPTYEETIAVKGRPAPLGLSGNHRWT